MPYGSDVLSADRAARSASVKSWLTVQPMKKAVCEASLWILLISFGARVSTANQRDPRRALAQEYFMPLR